VVQSGGGAIGLDHTEDTEYTGDTEYTEDTMDYSKDPVLEYTIPEDNETIDLTEDTEPEYIVPEYTIPEYTIPEDIVDFTRDSEDEQGSLFLKNYILTCIFQFQ
jgi:hypothetical protein